MSHKQEIAVVVDDRDCLIDALKEMGFEVNENKTDLRAYDFCIKSDISVKKNGRQLMIGFIEQPDGAYKLEADFYGTGISARDFQEKVNSLHGKNKVTKWFSQNRYTTTFEQDEEGNVVVVGSRWN